MTIEKYSVKSIGRTLLFGVAAALTLFGWASTARAQVRYTTGLQAYWEIKEGAGVSVLNDTGAAPLRTITIHTAENTVWRWAIPTSELAIETLGQNPRIYSENAITKIGGAMNDTNQFTVDLWFTPASVAASVDADIFTIGCNGAVFLPCDYSGVNLEYQNDFYIRQRGDDIVVGVRDSIANDYPAPLVTLSNVLAANTLTYFGFSFYGNESSATRRVQVNINGVYSRPINNFFASPASLNGSWTDFPAQIAKDTYGDNPGPDVNPSGGADIEWLGKVYMVAVYDRALNAAELTQNYNATRGNQLCTDLDADTYGDPGNVACPSGSPQRDCDDTTADDPAIPPSSCAACTCGVTAGCSMCAKCIRPGATEVCDSVDNNCVNGADDGVLNTYYRDADSDTYGNSADTAQGCSAPAGYVANSTDCDDTTADDPAIPPSTCAACTCGVTAGCSMCAKCIRPGATEVCDGKNNDCVGGIDNGIGNIYYRDVDGDGYGITSPTTQSCPPMPAGYADNSTDCDDTPAASGGCGTACHPGLSEVCDAYDNDCNGAFNDGAAGSVTYCPDVDIDGHGSDVVSTHVSQCSPPLSPPTWRTVCDDCADNDSARFAGNPEICDRKDNNCAGGIDEGVTVTYYRDEDGDGYGITSPTTQSCPPTPAGYANNSTDCDDLRAQCGAACHPGLTEICDPYDNDCNGTPNDGTSQLTWYADQDSDGFGDSGATQPNCFRPVGFVADNTDCQPNNTAVNPGATEACDGTDNDCDPATPDGKDVGGYNVPCNTGLSGDCSVGSMICDGALPLKCLPYLSKTFEVCDGKDNDCDGIVDKGCFAPFGDEPIICPPGGCGTLVGLCYVCTLYPEQCKW